MEYQFIRRNSAVSPVVCGFKVRKALIAAVVLAGMPLVADAAVKPRSVSTCPSTAYITNSYADTVSAIDTTTNQVIATIPVGNAPVNPTFTPDGKQVYVANVAAGTLSVIDTASNKVVDIIPTGGNEPSGLAFTPDGRKLVMTIFGQQLVSRGQVVIMDVATRAMSAPIEVELRPERLAAAPDGQHAYAINLLSKSISVVDLELAQVTATIPAGIGAFNALVSADGSKVYVGNTLSNSVSVITDPLSDSPRVEQIRTDAGPDGMAFSLDKKSLFVTNVFGSSIQRIDLATNTVVKTRSIDAFPGYLDITPDGKHAYVVYPFGNKVSVIDTSTLRVVKKITAGFGPTVVAICHSH